MTTTMYHRSEKPEAFEDFVAYVNHLNDLLKREAINSVTAVEWEQGAPIRAEIELKFPPRYISAKMTLDKEEGES